MFILFIYNYISTYLFYVNTITINTKSFNIQDYNSLINDNISAYRERKQVFGSSNENDNLFQPSGLLTFSETTGGKNKKKTRKLRRTNKFKRTKKLRKVRKTKE
jgi:flagellar basal body rod protein FlgC